MKMNVSQTKCLILAVALTAIGGEAVLAQSVCLPAPRLLTTVPYGGQAGTTVDVTITGENLEDVDVLVFSDSRITATPKLNESGIPIENQFVVKIAADCPVGIHEARVMTRLGVSSARAFNVGTLPEITRPKANTTLETAVALELDSICNAYMTRQAVDFYSFAAKQGQRVVVDCAAKGIDSKLNAVLVVADEKGNDLKVERRGGAIDFTAPEDGTYVIKVHDLTYDGGPYYFYRLALQTAAADEVVPRLPSTRHVGSVSWPPIGLNVDALLAEAEPNNAGENSQKITLPCDITGSFYPAADVDFFEFEGKKGDVWWVEVASERLGRPTDPSIVVQTVKRDGDKETIADLVELTDIASPVKVSSNGYSYDGPPYNAGSSDIIGKVEIKEDGLHRLRLTDLFGGTRSDQRNIYRLIVRKAQPDFAIVAWPLHMTLRNGDRNALSKPIALRGGSTVAWEVVVIRRDGFNGPIDMVLEDLPSGVSSTGLQIPAGQSRGILLVTAAENAPPGLTNAKFYGKAEIDGQEVIRSGKFASVSWPVPNAWSEIPSPRLLADTPVSACGNEQAPLTITAVEDKVYEVVAGETLTIPLKHTRRSDFSGTKMSAKTFGPGFEGNPAFDIPIDADSSEAVIDTSKLKTQPGDYEIAFYGSAVAKYRYHPEAVSVAEQAVKIAKEKVEAITAELEALKKATETVTDAEKPDARKSVDALVAEQKAAQQAVTAAEKTLKTATAKAQPKDIVDIVISTPIQVRVLPNDKEDKS